VSGAATYAASYACEGNGPIEKVDRRGLIQGRSLDDPDLGEPV
jgi:hypothetical protein